MRGWSTQIAGEWEPIKGVVGIVVAQKFPDPQSIRKNLESGIERLPDDTVWVMRDGERDNHAAKYAWQTFRAHGITPFQAPLVPAWKGNGVPVYGPLPEGVKKYERVLDYDLRADWRDSELRSTCERVVVFHDKSSGVTAEWLSYRTNHLSLAKIMVVERGKSKRRTRTGRAPD